MTKVWAGPAVGWAYLVCVIDCCTREIMGWNLSHRCRAEDALAAVVAAIVLQSVRNAYAQIQIPVAHVRPKLAQNNGRRASGYMTPDRREIELGWGLGDSRHPDGGFALRSNHLVVEHLSAVFSQ
jgi:transposase InsO family protein